MQIVYDDGERRRELDVRVNNPAATVADLAVALDPRLAGDDRALVVDGAAADPDLELIESGLHEGAMVRFGRGTVGPLGGPLSGSVSGPAATAWEGGALELVVVNGLDAGRRFPLTSGTAVIGRIPGSDILLHHSTVSKRHASVSLSPEGDVTISDLESHNGSWVGNEPVVAPTPVAVGIPIRLGALELEVRNVRDDDRPLALDPLRHVTAAGTIPFNRPPRPAPPPPLELVTAPQPPNTGSGKTPFSVIGIIAPLIFAGVMFAVMKSPQFLLFAGLTPIMGIANAVDSRRKGKKTSKAEGERFRTEMREFRQTLAEVVAIERDRREVALPDPAEVVRRVMLPSTTLWERRPGHGDFLRLRVGLGDVPWQPPVGDLPRGAATPEELRTTLQDASILREAPVVADLSGGGVVGVVGDRDAAVATARSLVCQAAALHGPADMPVMVLASRDAAPDWDWTKWLPHTRDSSGMTRQLSGDPELSTRLVESRLKAYASRDRHDRASSSDRTPVGPTLLVVVDDESLTEG
ncbi:MAG: FHA domain-containing protein, partial [Acidimicrobiales bacterium]